MHKFQITLKEYYIMNKDICSNSGLIPKIIIFYFCISDIPIPNNYLHKIDAAHDMKTFKICSSTRKILNYCQTDFCAAASIHGF